MTRKSATNTAAASYVDQIREAVDGIQSRVEVPAAAREFVQRTAATVKERAESVHQGANDVATSAEKLATAFVGGYANFTRGLIDATFANVQHAFSTVERLAAAKTLSEAVQVQADYVRDNVKANYERVRSAAETARVTAAEGAEKVREELSRLNPYAKKAA